MIKISPPLTHQRGVALVMVLGMVAIIAAWASTAAYEDMVSLRRASNIQDELRATMANESAYSLVQYYLQEDYKLDPAIDSLEEDWAMDLPPFPVDEGLIITSIVDSNRFYNLNDLVNDAGVIQPKHVTQLRHLFILLEIDPALVHTLADWIDKDDLPSGNAGAEDPAYYNKDYKVKNARLDSWNELKLIRGFDRDILARLKTAATVCPSNNNGKSTVNINTATIETMMSLFPNMSTLVAETLFESRPYTDTTHITNQPWAAGGDLSRLRVASDTFILRAHATFGQASVREEFLLSRSGQNVRLIKRERLGWQL